MNIQLKRKKLYRSVSYLLLFHILLLFIIITFNKRKHIEMYLNLYNYNWYYCFNSSINKISYIKCRFYFFFFCFFCTNMHFNLISVWRTEMKNIVSSFWLEIEIKGICICLIYFTLVCITHKRNKMNDFIYEINSIFTDSCY